jgi:regulator of sirC expression with transglutaminase-like and TPR domain
VTTLEAIRDELAQVTAGPSDEVPIARAALLIAQSEYPDLDIDLYEHRLQSIAERLEEEIREVGNVGNTRSPRQIPLTVNRLLYRELGFRGNDAAYEDPRNLYLNYVLDERTGIPVTMALVYSEICQRAGIDVRPVGLPGHVICRYQPSWSDEPADSVLLDVFNAGRVLSERDCQVLVKNTFGSTQQFHEHYLATLTPRQLLQRVLHNLKVAYVRRGDEDRAARIIELKLTLFPWDLDEIRDRGMLRERLGDYALAIEDLEHYVVFRPGARDVQTVRETLRSLRLHRASSSADDAEQPNHQDLPN